MEAGGEVMVGGEGEMEDASMDQGVFAEAEGGDSKVSSIVEVALTGAIRSTLASAYSTNPIFSREGPGGN
ncbi:hypothetical protein COCNU_scaffold036998G000030 [Cocos nucifera]|nr:hypothetical protein [Cocos nucifera]